MLRKQLIQRKHLKRSNLSFDAKFELFIKERFLCSYNYD
jgi:hypothetical protein